MSEVTFENSVYAALAAGIVATLVTVAIERWGGRRGGVLGTMPTTIVPASIGLWLQTDPEAFAAAMDLTPAGMGVNAVFLWLWRAVPPRLGAAALGVAIVRMVAISLGAWFVLALLTVWAAGELVAGGTSTLTLAIVATAVLVGLGLWGSAAQVPAPRGHRRTPGWVLIARGLFAAVAIFATVALAEVAGPLIAGVLSVFPAIFCTTMVALWLSQGRAVPAGAVGPMMLGSSSVAIYALTARYTFVAWGPTLGSVTAWGVAIAVASVPSWWWVNRRSDATS